MPRIKKPKEKSMPDGNGGTQIIRVLSDYVGYLWMLALALWGGTVSYVTRIKAEGRSFKLLELLAQWLTSGFVGLLAGYISLAMADSLLLAFVFSGVAGHMGAAALVLIERWVKDRFGVKR